jgi:hypothetical protein
MATQPNEYGAALDAAMARTREWLASLPDRRVPASASVDEIVTALGPALPDGPSDPAKVVDLLAQAAEPGLVATPSGRFFGLVIGGS